jgi:hypothetical protein
MDNKITYNGKTYNSINDLPPEARKIFEDKDGNNVPDVFEGLLESAKEFRGSAEMTSSAYVVDGKTYNSLDEVPAEQREMIKEKFRKLEQSGLKPYGNQVTVETKSTDIKPETQPGNLDTATSELSANFPFKLIMLFIFLGFMIFFIYSLIRMLAG